MAFTDHLTLPPPTCFPSLILYQIMYCYVLSDLQNVYLPMSSASSPVILTLNCSASYHWLPPGFLTRGKKLFYSLRSLCPQKEMFFFQIYARLISSVHSGLYSNFIPSETSALITLWKDHLFCLSHFTLYLVLHGPCIYYNPVMCLTFFPSTRK